MFLLKKSCDQCPWTKGGIDLRPGRLKDIADGCRAEDVPFICHKSIYHDEDMPEDADDDDSTGMEINYDVHVVCRGFYDALPGVGQIVRIAGRLGKIEEVEDPLDPLRHPKKKDPRVVALKNRIKALERRNGRR